MNSDQKTYDEIDIREVIRVLWRGKWIIVGITFVFAVISVIYALSLSNLYSSHSRVAPTEESQGGGLAAMSGELGGLASLAGVDLGQGQTNDAMLAVEILSSRKFISDFVRRHEIEPELMAVEEWYPGSGEIRFNPEVYDGERGTWVREVEPPKQAEPSDWELVEVFRERFSVERDELTGFVNITVEHKSPVIAQQWSNWLIEDINNHMRERDMDEASRSIEYLEEEISRTKLANMEELFYQLFEQQTQTIMMAKVRPEYVFRVIDPPVVAEEKSWPPRAIICIGITLFGGLFGVVVVLIMNMFRRDSLVDR